MKIATVKRIGAGKEIWLNIVSRLCVFLCQIGNKPKRHKFYRGKTYIHKY